MEILPTITTQILATTIYANGIINLDKIRAVLLSIEKDCNRYTSRPESMILHGYKVQGRRIVINYSLYTYMTLFSYLAVPSMPLVLDVVMPLNQSREKQYIFVANYSVDNEEYYYYLCIHMYIGAIAVGHLFAVCESMYMLYVRHADALFAIVGHQLKTVHVLHPKGSIDVKDEWSLDSREFMPDEQEQLYKKLCVCIQGHQNAIKYTELVESIFTKSLFFELFCTLIRLSITGAQTVLNLDNLEAVIRFGSFSLSQSFYILLLCLPGQNLLNHSENVYTALCESMWYTFPKKSQNLYMFLVQRSLKPSKITALNIVPMTMETYLSIMKTAMSYFTVLLSAQEAVE
ncbi:uncharacterized protein LOC143369988 isoform X2 [Andrena cerasifolii]|uniref:uncharacterized protein LOC143369988 isoform X2 n=1 Tax=Andrena cerasifolii TaxID=2819439 RepID=UPI0040376DAC